MGGGHVSGLAHIYIPITDGVDASENLLFARVRVLCAAVKHVAGLRSGVARGREARTEGEGVVEKDELPSSELLMSASLKRRSGDVHRRSRARSMVHVLPGERHEPRVDGGDLEKDRLGFSAPPSPPPLLGSYMRYAVAIRIHNMIIEHAITTCLLGRGGMGCRLLNA